MQRWRGVDAAPAGWGRSVVTIGVFDGVHRGHQEIIEHTVRLARRLGLASVVISFDPHPSEVVRPGTHPSVLTDPDRKAALLERLGVDVFCLLPFTVPFSQLSPESFAHDVLVAHLHAAAVVIGENFRFGHRAAGDVTLLAQLGRKFGFTVEGAPLVAESDTVFSSTYIRSCIDAGDVGAAAAALGRPHRLSGVVVRGDRRGRLLGFPTANVLSPPRTAIPADGVYAGWLLRNAEADRLPAAISIGTNPQFSGKDRRVEAYALDFDGDLYGERVDLDFIARLREMRRFDAVESLVAQIEADVRETRQILGCPPLG
ncbi:MAG: bifunctional riboflavin kinase/FAD synthetase [Actinocatenispora sp.]